MPIVREFDIVIAGLAVSAGAHPDLGPLATGYVLILAAFGPLAARLLQPLITATRPAAAYGNPPIEATAAPEPASELHDAGQRPMA